MSKYDFRFYWVYISLGIVVLRGLLSSCNSKYGDFKMKKAILIGIVLAAASSSAFAWTQISQTRVNDNSDSYSIKCNSGAQTTVTSNVNFAQMKKYFNVMIKANGQTGAFPNLDNAAKQGCGEK